MAGSSWTMPSRTTSEPRPEHPRSRVATRPQQHVKEEDLRSHGRSRPPSSSFPPRAWIWRRSSGSSSPRPSNVPAAIRPRRAIYLASTDQVRFGWRSSVWRSHSPPDQHHLSVHVKRVARFTSRVDVIAGLRKGAAVRCLGRLERRFRLEHQRPRPVHPGVVLGVAAGHQQLAGFGEDDGALLDPHRTSFAFRSR